MAGNLALAESSPEIGFLLKQTANRAAGDSYLFGCLLKSLAKIQFDLPAC